MPKKYPCIIHSHATTWHDGCVAILLKNGSIVALESERVGDRYKHSWDSKVSYNYLKKMFKNSNLVSFGSKTDYFIDQRRGLENTGHHLYHASSAFFASPFKESAVLVIDGQGPERGKIAPTSLWKAEGNKLELIDDSYFLNEKFAYNSLGHFYTAISALAGMDGLYDSGKTMGLSAYGKPSKFLDFCRRFVYSNSDGSYNIDRNFLYAILGNTYGPKYYGWKQQPSRIQSLWNDILRIRGRSLKRKWEKVSQEDMDIAFAGQTILEEIVLGLVKKTKNLTNSNNLCLSGGVILNSVSNGKILQSGIFKNYYIFSAVGDESQAIGKLFYDIHLRGLDICTTSETAYYGLLYNKRIINSTLKKFKDKIGSIEYEEDQLIKECSDRLLEGQVLGFFQGRSELGPRALGNRSILASPLEAGIRDYINSRIKNREWYRPFGLSILEEKVEDYFDLECTHHPFMSSVFKVKSQKIKSIPAVVHIDDSARIQTINKSQNPRFYDLIDRFYKKTGVPVLLNTSFNTENEPIVESPEDAIKTFLNTPLDALILENNLITKKVVRFH